MIPPEIRERLIRNLTQKLVDSPVFNSIVRSTHSTIDNFLAGIEEGKAQSSSSSGSRERETSSTSSSSSASSSHAGSSRSSAGQHASSESASSQATPSSFRSHRETYARPTGWDFERPRSSPIKGKSPIIEEIQASSNRSSGHTTFDTSNPAHNAEAVKSIKSSTVNSSSPAQEEATAAPSKPPLDASANEPAQSPSTTNMSSLEAFLQRTRDSLAEAERRADAEKARTRDRDRDKQTRGRKPRL